MMYFNIFDTETTGLTSHDEVIQYAGLLVRTTTRDEMAQQKADGRAVTYLKLVKLYNFYCDTQQKINPEAQKIHGIDRETLKKLSDGYTFEDNFYQMLSSMNSAAIDPVTKQSVPICWVAYNVAFDKRLINQTLVNNGLPAFNFGKNIAAIHECNNVCNFCMMNAATALSAKSSRQKLSAVVEEVERATGISAANKFELFAQKCNLDPQKYYHDAVYDIFCTYFVMEHYYIRLRG